MDVDLAAESGPSLLITLGLPVLAAIVLSPLTAWITFVLVTKRQMTRQLELDIQRLEFVKRPELAANVRSTIEQHGQMIALTEDQARRERVRRETLVWANPILAAVEDLKSRLNNILDDHGYLALSANWQKSTNWSITHDYFLTSTLYLFAVYFGYVELMRQSISLELFREEKEKDQLFKGLDRVSSALGSYPPKWPCVGSDTQVFRLQQRALGELMIVDRQDKPSCVTYPDFLDKLGEQRFTVHVGPLRDLIEALGPGGNDCRWRRVTETRDALSELSTTCRQLLLHRMPFKE